MILTELFFGRRARFYLFTATVILLFTALGARDLWTQEHRWADIVAGMFYRNDFLHPYLGVHRYYDKPLLSYWLIVFLTKVWGELTTWTLRLPSALSGMLALWSIYQLGTKLNNRTCGILASWMLLTTFYFVFWARTSSADMLNLAGSLFAVAWYFNKKDAASFTDYAIFFIILALTSLCKGLVGFIVPLIAVLVDVCLHQSWKQYLRLPIFLSTIPGIVIYLTPFVASSWWGGQEYGQSGLYLVYRENVLRYFQPFDHQGPIYTYFIYLPIYLMPWAIFFVPALFSLKSRWQQLPINVKWCAWTLLCLFVFFTLSGSRRSYYVLPIVPFAILFTADWIYVGLNNIRATRLAWFTASIFLFLFLIIDLIPAWYYTNYGANKFAQLVKHTAANMSPQSWNQWQVVFLDGESKLNFYFGLPPVTEQYGIKGGRDQQTTASLGAHWAILNNKPANTIFITRQVYADQLAPYFMNYEKVALSNPLSLPFHKQTPVDSPIAFIPKQNIN